MTIPGLIFNSFVNNFFCDFALPYRTWNREGKPVSRFSNFSAIRTWCHGSSAHQFSLGVPASGVYRRLIPINGRRAFRCKSSRLCSLQLRSGSSTGAVGFSLQSLTRAFRMDVGGGKLFEHYSFQWIGFPAELQIQQYSKRHCKCRLTGGINPII